ncbi:MAG: TolC family protein [Candidatus Riflebacteria bacterium]|nr:TolC family protein [Candidatus Riflebacteria bacterium]
MELFQHSVDRYPIFKSLQEKTAALKDESRASAQSRFWRPFTSALRSNYRTSEAGQYPISDVNFVNSMDIFNKTRLDRQKNATEIQRNQVAGNTERKTIFLEILSDYYNFIKNEQLLRLHKENLIWLDEIVAKLKVGVEAGEFPEADLAQWKIEQLNQENLIEVDQLEIGKSEEILKRYSGMESISTDSTQSLGEICTDSSEFSEEIFLKNCPELSTFELDKKQIQLDIRQERQCHIPELQFSHTYEINKDPSGNGNQSIAQLGFNFQLPDGGRSLRIRANKRKINGLEEEKRAQIITFQNEFRGKLKELLSGKTVLANLKKSEEISQESVAKYYQGYLKKFITCLTFIQAIKEKQTIQESGISTLINNVQTYQYLYHVCQGDLFK